MSLHAAYRRGLEEGRLTPDPVQELAVEKLAVLASALTGYRARKLGPDWKARLGWLGRAEEPPRGLYLFGPAGRGKSFLLDLFFEAAPLARKRRVHFHAFMLEVHDRLHRWRAGPIQATVQDKDDPLAGVVRELAQETWLLCFDELVVQNIADAMILGRLFKRLLAAGVILVITSNFPPRRLYEGGLQRERFLPFIELVEARLDLLDLGGGQDYRLGRLAGRPSYLVPADAAAKAALDQIFTELANGQEAQPLALEVLGRRLEVPCQARGVARFSFPELCARPLGSADYLALAARFPALIVEAVPRLGPETRNEARRFMHLIDALYEHRSKLFLSAEVPAETLYTEGEGTFEFRRTVSRLAEMRSQSYWNRPHIVV